MQIVLISLGLVSSTQVPLISLSACSVNLLTVVMTVVAVNLYIARNQGAYARDKLNIQKTPPTPLLQRIRC